MHLLTQSALLSALGWTLVNSLWQMGLLWFAWCLLVTIFRRAPSRFRHGLALSLLSFGALGSLVEFVDLYFFHDRDMSGWTGAGLMTGGRLVPLVLPYCSTLYLLILSGLMFRYLYQYRLSRRLTRRGLVRMPAELRVFIDSRAHQMGIRPKVNGWLSRHVDVPMTMGFWKPVILLPVAMISHLSTQQVEAILIHELAHIRRKDWLVNLLVSAAGLFFFFNPFARMLIRQLEKEREHCCDDEVLQFSYDPHAYVSALLSLARQHRQARVVLAATGGGDDQLLLQRARKILQQKRADRRPGVRPFLLLGLVAAMMVLSLFSPRGTKPVETPLLARVAGFGEAPGPAMLSGKAIKARTAMVVIHSAARAVANPRATAQCEARPAHSENKKPRPTSEEVRVNADIAGTVAPVGGSAPDVSLTQPATLAYWDAAAIRDNSLGKPADDGAAQELADDLPPLANLVFVPNSSFSFRRVDTLRPEDKLSWMEETTEREIRAQVERLQRELDVQLALLKRQESRSQQLTAPSQRELKKLLNQQIQLQRDYLHQLDELQKRLRKAAHHLTTVYI